MLRHFGDSSFPMMPLPFPRGTFTGSLAIFLLETPPLQLLGGRNAFCLAGCIQLHPWPLGLQLFITGVPTYLQSVIWVQVNIDKIHIGSLFFFSSYLVPRNLHVCSTFVGRGAGSQGSPLLCQEREAIPAIALAFSTSRQKSELVLLFLELLENIFEDFLIDLKAPLTLGEGR